ncbi:MAG: S41 family peptidase [Stellaceae bacterium]
MMGGSTNFRSLFARPAVTLSRCSAFAAAILALCACAAKLPPAVGLAHESALFADTTKDILEYHIKKVSPDQLAFDGLARLARLDSELSVVREKDRFELRRGANVLRFPAPPHGTNAGWGTFTAQVIAGARSLSPAIAAMPPDRLEEMIIDASLAALDPYSRYVRPEIARERRAARDGFDGIGVTLDLEGAAVRIASVVPDTPAARAGLLPGDRIVSLNGTPVTQVPLDVLRRHLRGPEQSPVQLAVARRGRTEPLEISLLRAKIVPETATLKEEGGIAWLKVRYFNQRTAQSLAELLRQAHHDLGTGLHGLVLDLRDNPGGLLDQSVEVVSLFRNAGDVVSTIGRNPQSMQHFTVIKGGSSETLPLVVLINGGSASASEIVAAALQDSGRAVVVGTSSYGKGTVQTVLRTENDGELTVTWAQIITPAGYFLNTHGVVPTLCTAGLSGSAASVDALLAKLPSPVPAALASPRAMLDDAGWQHLRARCPAGHDGDGVDRHVASELLDNATLYHSVLARLGGTRLAANP